MNNQYDKIAEQYSLTEEATLKKYCYGPSLVKLCGNLSRSTVIDAACGTGSSTRLVQLYCHPKSIFGIDSSKKEIAIARLREKEAPLGITYTISEIEKYKFTNSQKADVVTALFLLHYSPTKTHLLQVCKSIYKALKPMGTFVTINSNSEHPAMDYKELHVTSKVKGILREGAPRTVTYWKDGKDLCSFTNYYWSKNTYVHALREAGFKSVHFSKPIISKEGYKKYGKTFWKNYLAKPDVIGITCKK